jgi:hypothetical protein
MGQAEASRAAERAAAYAPRAARIIASVTVSVTIIGGVVIHFADENNFPDIGDGL